MKYIKEVILCIALTITSAHAYEPERAIVNLAAELAECSAFFSLMGSNGQNDERVSADALAAADRLYAFSVGISNEKVTLARIELSLDGMMESIDNNWSNTAILLNKYLKPCAAMAEDPEERLEYWLKK